MQCTKCIYLALACTNCKSCGNRGYCYVCVCCTKCRLCRKCLKCKIEQPSHDKCICTEREKRENDYCCEEDDGPFDEYMEGY